MSFVSQKRKLESHINRSQHDLDKIDKTGISTTEKQNESLFHSKHQPNEIESTLIDALATFWKEEKFTDVKICCGLDSDCINTHSLILGALSPFLKRLMETMPYEDVIIVLPDVNPKVLKNFLNKVYQGSDEKVMIPDDLQHLNIGLDHNFDSISDFKNRDSDISKSSRKKSSKRKRTFETIEEKSTTSNLDLEEDSFISGTNGKKLSSETIESTNLPFMSKEANETKDYENCAEFTNVNSGIDLEQNKHQVKMKLGNATGKRNKTGIENQLVMFSKSKGPRIGTPSIAWNFFEMASSNAAKCLVCGSLVTTTFSSTSGLLKHLKNKHLDYCEKWERDNVRKFDSSILDSTDMHPIRKHFQEIEKQTWSCSYCDTIFVGIDSCAAQNLDDHLKEHHSESFREYELEKVAILCRKGKENRSRLSNLVYPSAPLSSKSDKLDVIQKSGTSNDYLNTGFCNVLAKDFYTNLDKETLQCTLCLGTVKLKVPTNPNSEGLSINLWKHLKVSHFDIYEKLEIEKADLLENLKLCSEDNPIWKYYKSIDLETANCIECMKDIKVDISSARSILEGHLSSVHNHNYTNFKHEYKEWNEILGEELKNKYTPGLPTLIKLRFTTLSDSSLKCNECEGLVIVEETEMFDHLKSHHKHFLEAKIKPNIINNDGSRDKVKIHLGECFCIKCDKANLFSSKTALESHDRYIHLKERPYRCEQCSRTFIRGDELKLHKRYHQNRESKKGAMCSHCGMVFNSSASRIRHENTVHHNIRRHSCTCCGKKFASTQALERHSRIHSDLKPHQCNDCGQQFREIAHLKVHYRTHSGEKPISCPNCPLRFKHYAGRRSHQCEGTQ